MVTRTAEEIKETALSAEDKEGLPEDEVEFLSALAVFFAQYEPNDVPGRFGIFTIKQADGMRHCMGNLSTLVATNKKFHFVGRRKTSSQSEQFEEFVVKVERIAGNVQDVLPQDDPTCGWEWNGYKWVYVCRS